MDLNDPALARIAQQITQGDLPGAHYGLQKHLRRSPANAETARVAAMFCIANGDSAAAISGLELAIQRFPNVAALHEDLAMALAKAGRRDDAVAQFQRALAIDPDRPVSLLMMCDHLLKGSAWSAAEVLLTRLVMLTPDDAECWNKLGVARQRLGMMEQAVDALTRAQTVTGSTVDAIANDALLATYRDDLSTQEVFERYRRAGEMLTAPQPLPPPPARRDGRLRVGYVSPDFYQHSAATFFEPVIRHHDRSEFEIFCYSHGANSDAVTQRLRACAETWRDIRAVADAAVVEQIRADDIDILIDLAGHTGGSRLTIFGFKPGRVQATYLGWPSTTGMRTIDFRVTDWIADPDAPADAWHSEKLIRLPNTFFCYGGPPFEVPFASQPREDRPLTFAVPTRVLKIRPAMIALWCEILSRVEGSQLVVQADCATAPQASEWLMREFARDSRIDPSRIQLRPRLTMQDYFAEHANWDVGLDTSPFNGHTTTCHALWMGLPMVTLAGQMHASRMGASVLHALELDDLIANSPQEYVERAVQLALDTDRRRQLRATLRDRMKSSYMCNGQLFARDFEAVLHTIAGDE